VKSISETEPNSNDSTAEFSEEETAKAEEFKSKGNELFKNNKFADSVEQYTEAIFCKISNTKKAIYYCNRSLASLKMEEFQLSLFDACEAIKLDPTNVKGFYRRG